MNAWNVDRVALARTYLRAFFQQSLTHGFFHADPHASNGLCTPDGRLVMLDFGMVKQLPENIRHGLTMEWMGAFFRNPRMYTDGVIAKGAIGEVDRAAVEETATRIFNDDRMRDLIFGRELSDGNSFGDFLGEADALMGKLETFKTPQDELMFLRGLGIAFDTAREIVPEMKLMDLAEPIYVEVFQRVLAEHPEYAAYPFQLTVKDADVARMLSRWLETKGFRDVTVAFEDKIIRARAAYPLTRYGAGVVTASVSASFVAFDAGAQLIVLDVTTLDVVSADTEGVLSKALSLARELVLRALAPFLREGQEFAWGRVESTDGSTLPLRLHVKLDAVSRVMLPYASGIHIDELTIGEGSILLARKEGR